MLATVALVLLVRRREGTTAVLDHEICELRRVQMATVFPAWREGLIVSCHDV